MISKFPRINLQSKGLERTLSSAFVLIPSLGCTVAGLWLGYEAAIAGHRGLAYLGLLIFMGGMTIVPIGLAILGNRLFRVERERLRLKPAQRAAQAKVRKLEKQLKYAYLIQRHPIIVPVFCFCALVVCIGMAIAPEWAPKKDNQSTALEIMGIIFGAAYFVALALYFFASATKRWEPYMDASIRKTAMRLEKIKDANPN